MVYRFYSRSFVFLFEILGLVSHFCDKINGDIIWNYALTLQFSALMFRILRLREVLITIRFIVLFFTLRYLYESDINNRYDLFRLSGPFSSLDFLKLCWKIREKKLLALKCSVCRYNNQGYDVRTGRTMVSSVVWRIKKLSDKSHKIGIINKQVQRLRSLDFLF